MSRAGFLQNSVGFLSALLLSGQIFIAPSASALPPKASLKHNLNQTQKPAASKRYLVLKQQGMLVGGSKVYAGKDSLRVEFGTPTAYLVANAPTWHVYLYNKSNNKGLDMSYEDWLKHTPHWLFALEDEEWLRRTDVVKTTPVKILGQNCDQYRLGFKGADGVVRLKAYGVQGTISVAKSDLVSQPVCRILERIYTVPKLAEPGVPIRVSLDPKGLKRGQSNKVVGLSYKNPSTSPTHALVTNDVSVQEISSDNLDKLFAIPQKFERQKFEDSVLRDQSHQDSSKDLLEIMD